MQIVAAADMVKNMKKQIRNGVFETNSSSVHSLTMCSESDYDRWIAGELLLYKGYGSGFPAIKRPEMGRFYTKEKAIEFIMAKCPPPVDFDWEDDDLVMEMLHEYDFFDVKYWEEYYLEDYEDFLQSYVTSSGERIIAFGYYGDNY